MEKTEVIERLTAIFRTVFKDSSLVIFDEMTAKDVADWNSLTHMILISEIEKEFSVKFRLKELNKMKNVGALIEMLSAKI